MVDDRKTEPVPPLFFGPYQTIDAQAFGEGGMGVVYKAMHVDSREVVAIKTIKAADPTYVASIRREIRMLRRVQHPGLIPILADDVTDDGVPWIAMPFVQGPTLHDHLRLLPTRSPRALRPTLTLIRRLCVSLAFLHGEGLVHRDLKPQNVLLQGDRPVLIDLGIAGHFAGAPAREELDVPPWAGSPLYMAPEQFSGNLVDARADLYALGCILYECATGVPPFVGASNKATAEKHVHELLIPPSRRAPGVSPALEKLILRLLEKDPAKRMGYAADVAAELIALGAEADEDGPRARPYLYRPPFQGRKDLMALCGCAVESLQNKHRGGLMLIHGESGLGKTRLMMELVRAAQPRMNVLTAQCQAVSAGKDGATVGMRPLAPLLPLLRAAADRVRNSQADAEHVFGPRGRILAPYEPSLLDLPGQAEQKDPPPLPPRQAQARVIAAMLGVLVALGEREPLLVVLDDLQWADELTLRVLDAFAKAEPLTCGVLLIGTYRSEAARVEVDALLKMPGVDAMPLDRLKPWEIADIAVGMLATREPPRAVLEALTKHANGNPFFVAQYLHAALERGILRRDAAGNFGFDALGAAKEMASLPLPHTVEELITGRLDRLDAEGQAFTAWAAVLGETFDEELFRAGVQDGDVATEVLDALTLRGILEPKRDGSWGFAHGKLAEIAYLRIEPSKRTLLHRQAAEVLEARFGRVKTHAAELGHHFDRAGLHAKAARYFTQAATHARETFANANAIHLYEAAILARRRAPHTKGKPAELARLLESRGDMLALAARHEEALSAYDAALAENPAATPMDRARRLRKGGETWKARKQLSLALVLYQRAEASLAGAPRTRAWWNEWLRIQMERLFVYYLQGNMQALAALRAAVEPDVMAWGTAQIRARYYDRCAMLNLRCERYRVSKETLRCMRQSVAAARKGRDVHDLLGAEFDFGIILWLGVRLRKADLQMLQVLEGAKRAEYHEFQTRSAAYLAVISRRQAQTELTRERAEESLRLARQGQMREYIGVALANLAWVARRNDDCAEAERLGCAALAQWQLIGELAFPFQWLARLPLFAALLARGDLPGAVEQLRAVLAPNQQRLPSPIESVLVKAIDAFAEQQEDRAVSDLRAAFRVLRKLGYA
ncbi:serine/threonine-protein kinase PknK [Polyangium sorediatum]|uniref:Protein kinase n=1 Tax=Polyangium sorediatum TaxID=889274 RepID=A0ABT6NPG9_9BACT|nr:serine/threonine-protein kinase [Polyangium sorediatum]MDI1430203.1 protein kinase [Polyangium sorediatum]